MGDGEMTRLPEGFISDILSLTSPRDCCRSAAVSPTFRSAADSDTVWDRFLPSDLSDLLSRAVGAVDFASKKDLYFRLCDGVLVDGARMIFSLERSTGRRCFTLSARELSIIWGDSPQYWTWGPHQGSRFPEVAKLLSVCWLEIRGKLDCRVLSQRTNYAAYLIFKLAKGSYNLTNQEASVRVGSHVSESKVCLQPDDEADAEEEEEEENENEDEEEEEEEEDEDEEEEEEDDDEDEVEKTRVVGSHVSESEVCLQPDDEADAQEEEEEEEEEEDTRVVGSHVSESKVCLQPDDEAAAEDEDEDEDDEEDEDEVDETRVVVPGRAPRRRRDGWMEMELGEFSMSMGMTGRWK